MTWAAPSPQRDLPQAASLTRKEGTWQTTSAPVLLSSAIKSFLNHPTECFKAADKKAFVKGLFWQRGVTGNLPFNYALRNRKSSGSKRPLPRHSPPGCFSVQPLAGLRITGDLHSCFPNSTVLGFPMNASIPIRQDDLITMGPECWEQHFRFSGLRVDGLLSLNACLSLRAADVTRLGAGKKEACIELLTFPLCLAGADGKVDDVKPRQGDSLAFATTVRQPSNSEEKFR